MTGTTVGREKYTHVHYSWRAIPVNRAWNVYSQLHGPQRVASRIVLWPSVLPRGKPVRRDFGDRARTDLWRGSSDELSVSFHCTLDPATAITEAHDLTVRLEEHLRKRIPSIAAPVTPAAMPPKTHTASNI